MGDKMPLSLVTGGAGFIGSHVVDELVATLGHEVVVIDDLSGGFVENVNPAAAFVKGSVTDVNLVNHLFSQYQFDYVFHLAAYAAEGLSHFIRHFNYTNNLLGSMNLINASVNAGGVKCFVFTSSIAVYGTGQTPMSEDMIPQPEDPYGISKYAVELDIKSSHDMFGLNYVIFRPHNVYGERQNIGDRYRNVIGIFMNQIMQDKPMTMFGDGAQTRAFSYITDVAPIIAHSVHRPESYNQVFNVGADHPYTILELAQTVARSMSASPNVIHLEARNEVIHAYASHEKARRVFGDLMRDVSLTDGIDRMSAWARQHGSRSSQSFANIEIVKNLPKSWAESVSA
jgi:UDP-glucose 4-epimerase